MHRSRVSQLLAVLFLLGCGAIARGQNAGQPARENVRGNGAIKEAAGGILHVVSAGGDQYYVKLDARPQNVSFIGKAEPSWLQPGMLVRFTNQMDRRGKLLEPITAMAVVSLREGMQIGVQSENRFAKNGPGLFEEAQPEKKPAPKKNAGPPEPVPVLVIARIVSFKSGKLALDAGTGKQLKADLDEKARISIDMADLRWARPGDKAEFQGWAYAQTKNQVTAREITVTAAGPLANEKKRSAAKDAEADAPPAKKLDP